jgi:hypothetical protein
MSIAWNGPAQLMPARLALIVLASIAVVVVARASALPTPYSCCYPQQLAYQGTVMSGYVGQLGARRPKLHPLPGAAEQYLRCDLVSADAELGAVLDT